MNKKGGLFYELGFFAAYIFILFLAVGYAFGFIGQEELRGEEFFGELEKSVITNRVISCLSGENFGEIDENKVNENELRNCLGSSYNFILNLNTGTKEDFVFLGDVGVDSRGSGRFVLVDGERARLRVSYSKNDK